MLQAMKRIGRILLGWVCIVMGVVGLFLPILQGWLFLVMGIALLARDVPLFGRMLCWLERNVSFFGRWMAKHRRSRAKGDDAFPPC
jgi:uncharacterized membrane protein YbaN (DUF454 family)